MFILFRNVLYHLSYRHIYFGHTTFFLLLVEVRFAQSVVICVVSCRSLFVLLFFFFWLLCCLSFFKLQLLVAPLVSSNFSYNHFKISRFCEIFILYLHLLLLLFEIIINLLIDFIKTLDWEPGL